MIPFTTFLKGHNYKDREQTLGCTVQGEEKSDYKSVA